MYCDHKCTDTCPDCVEELIKLRKRIKELEEIIRSIRGILENESIRYC
jgi:hypothetical protein